MGVRPGAVAGLVSGVVMLRGHGLAQLVLSIAIIHLFHEAANKASTWTGGSDGLTGISPDPLLGLFAFDLWGRTAYVLGIVLLVVAFALLQRLSRSPFGMLCRGVRQDPVRIAAMGASVRKTLLKMYAISGAVAGVGGALNAIATQVVGLDSLSFTLSAEALVMLVLGGTGSLYGALIGTVAFMLFEDYVSAANPFHWLTIIGALLIAVVLFAPRGIYGTAADLLRRTGEPRHERRLRGRAPDPFLRRLGGDAVGVHFDAAWRPGSADRTERRRQDDVRQSRHRSPCARLRRRPPRRRGRWPARARCNASGAGWSARSR